jgi:hypothetical protein
VTVNRSSAASAVARTPLGDFYPVGSTSSRSWGHQAESPEVLAELYSIVQRMRLTSSDEVIRVAEQVTRLVIQAYTAA